MQNMDELMEMELDGPELEGKGKKVFAAGHACVCNPLKKPHYPKDWYAPAPSSFPSGRKLMKEKDTRELRFHKSTL